MLDCDDGGLWLLSSFSLSLTEKNSGAVEAKNMSFLDDIRLKFGMAIVCTKFPFIIKRISIVSAVKAITNGKAQAVEQEIKIFELEVSASKSLSKMITKMSSLYLKFQTAIFVPNRMEFF